MLRLEVSVTAAGKDKAVWAGQTVLNYDDSSFFCRRERGQCHTRIDSLRLQRFSSPGLFRRSFSGCTGVFRLGDYFPPAAPPAAFASSPAQTGGSPAPANLGGRRRPAAGSHRRTVLAPGLMRGPGPEGFFVAAARQTCRWPIPTPQVIKTSQRKGLQPENATLGHSDIRVSHHLTSARMGLFNKLLKCACFGK